MIPTAVWQRSYLRLQTPYAGSHGFQFSFIWFIIFFELFVLLFTLAITFLPSKDVLPSARVSLIEDPARVQSAGTFATFYDFFIGVCILLITVPANFQ